MHMSSSKSIIWTIGHSNHPLERFVELLRSERIQILVDVRSEPFSRYSPHFSEPTLRSALSGYGFKYLSMGKELGGRPEDRDFYDADGRALYYRVAASSLFRRGVERLLVGIEKYKVAIMCSEEDPAGCHRQLLVGRVLSYNFDVDVRHIRGNGAVEPAKPQVEQLTLALGEEETGWKSLRSALPRSLRSSSLRSFESTTSSD